MKNLKNSLAGMLMVLATLALTPLETKAQGFDYFGRPRTVVNSVNTLLGASVNTVTNAPIDMRGYDGVIKWTIFSATNAPGGTLTVQAYTSPDLTNWTALANYATATSANVITTNGVYGTTTLLATNTYLLPGAITTATPATAGYANTYLLPPQFTNTGAITVTAKGIYEIGYIAADANRYLQWVIATGGTATNAALGFAATGQKTTFP